MIDVFEEAASEYDDWFDRHDFTYRSELAAVSSVLPESGVGLEIGVGTGRFAGPLAIKFGLEPTRAMAEIAKNRGLQIIRGYAEALPIAAASIDFVLMVTVLCFLAKPEQALAEATRILRPSGRLIIGLIDPDSPLGKVYQAKKHENKFYRNARFYPVAQVLNWLTGLGYRTPDICQTIFQALPDLSALEPVKPGHGEGGFVVLAAQKII